MLKKYQLTILYWLEICSQFDEGALNGADFEAKKEWTIEEDMAGKWNYPYSYTTIAAQRFNLNFKHESPKYAIQKIVEYAYTGKETKLKYMWFKIVEKKVDAKGDYYSGGDTEKWVTKS
jgi:hypothetical protein